MIYNEKTKNNKVVTFIIVPTLVTFIFSVGGSYASSKVGDPIEAVNRFLVWLGIYDDEITSIEAYTEPIFINRSSEQFNYTIDCPSDFVFEGGEGQDTEDDFNLSSPDRKATLNFTARIIDGTLPDKFTIANFRRTYAGTEMYCDDQLESDGWYVVSTKAADGAFHYRKCIFTDGIVRMYTFSFPTEQEDVYLSNFDYVSHIEESFRKLY